MPWVRELVGPLRPGTVVLVLAQHQVAEYYCAAAEWAADFCMRIGPVDYVVPSPAGHAGDLELMLGAAAAGIRDPEDDVEEQLAFGALRRLAPNLAIHNVSDSSHRRFTAIRELLRARDVRGPRMVLVESLGGVVQAEERYLYHEMGDPHANDRHQVTQELVAEMRAFGAELGAVVVVFTTLQKPRWPSFRRPAELIALADNPPHADDVHAVVVLDSAVVWGGIVQEPCGGISGVLRNWVPLHPDKLIWLKPRQPKMVHNSPPATAEGWACAVVGEGAASPTISDRHQLRARMGSR